MDKPFPSDFEYYEAEIGWFRRLMDLRLAEVRAQGGGGVGGENGGLEETASAGVVGGTHAPQLADLQTLADESRAAIDNRLAANRQIGPSLIIDRMQQEFGLDDFDRRVLILALAPLLDYSFPGFIKRFWLGYRDTDQLEVTLRLALTLLGKDMAGRIDLRQRFWKDAPLQSASLMYLSERRDDSEHGCVHARILLPRRVYGALVGSVALDSDLVEISTICDPIASIDQVVLPEAHRALILRALDNHAEIMRCRKEWGFDRVIRYGRGLTFLFCGPPGTGKTMTAHAMAEHLGIKVIMVDSSKMTNGCEDWVSTLRSIFREAKLSRSLLFFDECEGLLASRACGNDDLPALLQMIDEFDGIAVFATNMPKVMDPAIDRRILVRLDFEIPTPTLRAEIWRKHLPREAPVAADLDLADLAERFEFSGGYVKNSVLMAVNAAASRPAEERVIGQADLEAAARHQSIHRGEEALGEAEMPDRGFECLVLPERTAGRLREIASSVRRRGKVLREWKAGGPARGKRSLGILFHGPSGSGKTLAAHSLAHELCLPLMRARPEAIYSMWLGRTEKNIHQIFDQAKAVGALLLFDEADAMFATRDTAHQRHDLNVTNLLLTELERYEGVVVLTTNRRDAIDHSFFRRLLFSVEFPLPGVRERVALWKLHLGEIPVGDDVDLGAVARAYELTGGGIRNAVMRAAFALAESGSGLLAHADIVRAAEDEAGSSPARRRAGFEAALL